MTAVRRFDVWTLLLASGLTVMAGAIVAPSLPGMVDAFADTPHVELLTRLVLTMPALAIVLGGTVVGVMVDRLGRRPVMVGGLVLYALAGTTGAYLTSLPAILVGRFALGLAVAAVMTSATTLITDLFHGAERGRFLGRQAAFMALGAMVFLITGGALADVGWRTPFGLYAASLLLIVPALRLPGAAREPGARDEAAPLELARGPMMGLLALGLLGMMLFYLVPVQLPFYLGESFGAAGLATGAAIATVTVTSSVSSLLFPRVAGRIGQHGALATTFAVAGVGLVGVGLATSWPVLVASLLFAGLGFGLLMPNLSSWLAGLAPERLRGRVVGALTTSFFAGQFLSPIVSAPVVARQGLGGPGGLYTLAGTSAVVLGAVLLWHGQRRSSRLARRTAEAAP